MCGEKGGVLAGKGETGLERCLEARPLLSAIGRTWGVTGRRPGPVRRAEGREGEGRTPRCPGQQADGARGWASGPAEGSLVAV